MARIRYADYYNSYFRADLIRFFDGIPARSKHHWYKDPSAYSIQPHTLVNGKFLSFLPSEKIPFFAAALFWTILVDQVCYTYYRNHYGKFRQLTQYPKLIGGCTSGCYSNIHPQNVYLNMKKYYASGGFKNEFERPNSFDEVFEESKSAMKEEIISFFKKYMPEINGAEFWEKCAAELPPSLR